jgi:lipoate-protein ligase A
VGFFDILLTSKGGFFMNWRYILYHTYDPYWNMAIDEAMLIAHSEGKVPPTLRFYGWQPATLSIGYFQRADKAIDRAKVEELELGFVRRMTGGRAVFHDQELTYSVVISESNPAISHSVQATHRRLNVALQTGLEQLMLKIDDNSAQVYDANSSAACFDAPGESEFLIQSRKVIGSAQTRQRGVLLQHGSILLDLDFDTVFQIFRFPTEKVKNNFQKRVGTLAGLQEKLITLEKVIQAFYIGFQDGLHINFIEEPLTSYEWQLAEQLVKEKYSRPEWNLKR